MGRRHPFWRLNMWGERMVECARLFWGDVNVDHLFAAFLAYAYLHV